MFMTHQAWAPAIILVASNILAGTSILLQADHRLSTLPVHVYGEYPCQEYKAIATKTLRTGYSIFDHREQLIRDN